MRGRKGCGALGGEVTAGPGQEEVVAVMDVEGDGVSLTALAARLLDGETERSRMTAGSRQSSWGMAQPVIGGHGDQGQQARWRRGGLGLEAGRWATEEPGPRAAGLLTSGLLVFHNKMAANSEDYTSQHSLERGEAT